MRYMILISTIISLFISGCGFQLRGKNSQLSNIFKKTHITWQGDDNNVFYRNVKRQIMLSGGDFVTKKDANISLHLSPITVSTRQIALSNDGRITEYEKIYQTTVSVIDSRNAMQLGSRRISAKKNIQLNDSQVLAGQEQTAITNTNAQQSLAQSTLLYLQSF